MTILLYLTGALLIAATFSARGWIPKRLLPRKRLLVVLRHLPIRGVSGEMDYTPILTADECLELISLMLMLPNQMLDVQFGSSLASDNAFVIVQLMNLNHHRTHPMSGIPTLPICGILRSNQYTSLSEDEYDYLVLALSPVTVSHVGCVQLRDNYHSFSRGYSQSIDSATGENRYGFELPLPAL